MKHKFAIPFASSILIFAILACNAPTASNPNQPDLALTVTSQALVIARSGNQTAETAMPGQSQTPARSAPLATVSQPTNCRSGPGSAYDLVTSLDAGQQAVVVGKDLPGNYWIINNPNGNGTCWLWGQYATVTGDTTSLPQVSPSSVPTPKATKTPKPTRTQTNSPLIPMNMEQPIINCASGMRGTSPIWIQNIILRWQDNANNESGYRISKSGTVIATLPSNSTQFKITMNYDQGTIGGDPILFFVEVFNEGGGTGQTVYVNKCH